MNQQQHLVPIKSEAIEGEVIDAPSVETFSRPRFRCIEIHFSNATVEAERALKKQLGDVAEQIRERTKVRVRQRFPWERDLDDGAIEIDG